MGSPWNWISWAGEEIVHDLVLIELTFVTDDFDEALASAEGSILWDTPSVFCYHGEMNG